VTAFLLALGVLILAAWVAQGVQLLRGLARVRGLLGATEPYAPVPPEAAPLVTVVVPARDEAAAVERAVRSLLAQDYPALEVLAVDDRSTDGTFDILRRLAAGDRRLAAIRVDRLPEAPDGWPAWLGKPHAMYLAASRARGAWLLFTDADVVHAPTVVSRAMRVALRDGRDHLTLFPKAVMASPLERAFMGVLGLAVLIGRQVWDIPDPRRSASIGIGAFNLVRRDLYDRFGGHAALRLEVVDDLALGVEAKRAGGRSEALFAGDLVWLRWYPSVAAAVRGLTKNLFAAVGYSVPAVMGVLALQAVLGLGPYLGLLLAPGPARLPYLATSLGILVAFAVYGRRSSGEGGWAAGLLVPAAALLFMAAFVRSTYLTLARGGVEWRGTLYPLAALRAATRIGLRPGVRS
jgi:hypothetical protein